LNKIAVARRAGLLRRGCARIDCPVDADAALD